MKKILSLILLIVSLLAASFLDFSVRVNAQTDEDRMANGLSFDQATTYDTEKALECMPKTFEAYIHLPKTYSKRAGVIFGNYMHNSSASYSLELQYDNTAGVAYPKIFYDSPAIDGKLGISFNFTKVDVRSDDYVHIAITHDTNVVDGMTTAYCYLNGELKQSVSVAYQDIYQNYEYVPTNVGRLGGDLRSGNAQYFKGYIKSVELYSDVKTEDEIKADYARLMSSTSEDDNLIAAYNLTANYFNYKKDLSGNGYDLKTPQDSLEDKDGMSFDSSKTYVFNKELSVIPNTVEAEFYLPESYTGRGGVILGNYSGGNVNNFSFEISTNGKPRFYYNHTSDTNPCNIIFDVDVRTGDWVKLAFTHDISTGKVYCYLNGELVAQSDQCYEYVSSIVKQKLVLGGDNRSGNEQYFKGLIKYVSIYSDVRTSNEIKNGVDLDDENLIAHYEVSSNSVGLDVEDKSNNGYDLRCQKTWFTDKEPVTNYAYSFAVVGDTQKLNYEYPDGVGFKYESQYKGIYDWIVANKESKKIAHVFGLGDITETWTKKNTSEWELAKEAISKLDGVVSYSLVRGNHDDSVGFNNTFNYDAYTNQFEGFMNQNDVRNSYMLLTVGVTDYLFITLDYGASDEELEWAGSIIEQYPNHKVVITTHAYMYRDGTTLDAKDVCPPAQTTDCDNNPNKVYNNGEQIWDKFISKYGNIVLVMSGHDPCDNVVTLQSTGIHGNTVTQMLIDPQGMDAVEPVGMVCMLYFSEDGSKMDVEFYSTVKQQYYKTSNQYTVDLSGTNYDAHQYESFSNDSVHWQECTCGKKIELEGHVWDNGVVTIEPTEDSTGEMKYTCNECGHIKTSVIDKIEHQHAYDDLWIKEEVSHWQECACGHKNNLGVHTWDNGQVTKEPEAGNSGEMTYTCTVCGHTKISVIEHQHSYSKEYESDDKYHWNECECGEIDNKGTHTGGTASETEKAVCDVCGHAYGELKVSTPSKGCGGSILSSIFGIIILVGTIVILRKAKKRV